MNAERKLISILSCQSKGPPLSTMKVLILFFSFVIFLTVSKTEPLFLYYKNSNNQNEPYKQVQKKYINKNVHNLRNQNLKSMTHKRKFHSTTGTNNINPLKKPFTLKSEVNINQNRKLLSPQKVNQAQPNKLIKHLPRDINWRQSSEEKSFEDTDESNSDVIHTNVPQCNFVTLGAQTGPKGK